MVDLFKNAKWICSEAFYNQDIIDIFHKQSENDLHPIDCPDDLKNVHTYFKSKFIASGNKTVIKISADDYYKLYINGNFVGQGPAQGYPWHYYYNEIDISDYIVDGENEIFADVYYHGLIARSYVSGDRRMGIIAEIYCDNQLVCATDKSWEYAVSENYITNRIYGNNTQFAENFDSRIKDYKYSNCYEKNFDHTFYESPIKNVQVYEIKPEISEEHSNGIFYDFSKEITAGLKIIANGKSGDKIKIYCAEEADDSEIKIRYNMRCGCEYAEEWILDSGENILNQYDYKGFRYVFLEPDNGVEISEISAVVKHYPFDDNYCNLETKNEVLKAVWELCKNGVKCGSQEQYVDCPQREKGAYAGDLTVTSDSQCILTGDYSLLKKAIDDQIQSAKICKGLMAVTPSGYMQEIADYSLQFPILALRYYKYTNDKEYLKECLEVCEGVVDYFKKYEREDGLLDGVAGKWNLVDWPVNLRDNYDFELKEPQDSGCHNVINAFYIGCVMLTEEIYDILEIKKDKRSVKLIESFNNAFYNDETKLYTDCEDSNHSAIHSNIIPLYFGFNKKESNDSITDLLMSKGLVCGVYMSYFLLKGLCRAGKYKEALKIVTSTDDNSWYNMVREGGTACFEAWGKDKKWNTSLCHPWASAPISVIAEDIIPNMPDVGKIIIRKDNNNG